MCNAVDVERFAPAAPDERAALRAELGLPPDVPLVLFVGFFSRDKRPDLLYRCVVTRGARGRRRSCSSAPRARPIRKSTPGSPPTIRGGRPPTISPIGCSSWSRRHTIEHYFRAADIYVLPSIREGFPIALLEAMSTGLPCVASRLPGSTDAIIDDGVNGLLVAPDDAEGFAAAIARLLDDRDAAARLGAAARQTVIERYLDSADRGRLAGRVPGSRRSPR